MTNQFTLVKISREEHLRRLRHELKTLPWWKFYRRAWLKRLIYVLGDRYAD